MTILGKGRGMKWRRLGLMKVLGGVGESVAMIER